MEMLEKILKNYKKFGDVSTLILAFDSIFYFYIKEGKEFLGKQHMLKFYDNDNDKFYNLFIRASIDWNLAIRYFSREILKKKKKLNELHISTINHNSFTFKKKKKRKETRPLNILNYTLRSNRLQSNPLQIP